MKRFLFSALILSLTLGACKKDKDHGGIYKGAESSVYHGKAYTWIQLSKEGNPEKIGVTINDAALNSVKIGGEMPSGDHQHEDNYVLALHPKAAVSPFRHVWLNWNPAGHEPAGVYDKPHFDIHFYMTPSSEREQYLDPVKLDAAPPADYLPVNHLAGDPVPTMGKHFVDLASPELNGSPFTQTFIYGSYDSKVVFYEPMITLDFLKTTSNFTRSIPQPAKFQVSGYYPTKMSVYRQSDEVHIVLEGFVYRTAS